MRIMIVPTDMARTEVQILRSKPRSHSTPTVCPVTGTGHMGISSCASSATKNEPAVISMASRNTPVRGQTAAARVAEDVDFRVQFPAAYPVAFLCSRCQYAGVVSVNVGKSGILTSSHRSSGTVCREIYGDQEFRTTPIQKLWTDIPIPLGHGDTLRGIGTGCSGISRPATVGSSPLQRPAPARSGQRRQTRTRASLRPSDIPTTGFAYRTGFPIRR